MTAAQSRRTCYNLAKLINKTPPPGIPQRRKQRFCENLREKRRSGELWDTSPASPSLFEDKAGDVSHPRWSERNPIREADKPRDEGTEEEKTGEDGGLELHQVASVSFALLISVTVVTRMKVLNEPDDGRGRRRFW